MENLEKLAKDVRKTTLSCIVSDGVGHVGAAFRRWRC